MNGATSDEPAPPASQPARAASPPEPSVLLSRQFCDRCVALSNLALQLGNSLVSPVARHASLNARPKLSWEERLLYRSHNRSHAVWAWNTWTHP